MAGQSTPQPTARTTDLTTDSAMHGSLGADAKTFLGRCPNVTGILPTGRVLDRRIGSGAVMRCAAGLRAGCRSAHDPDRDQFPVQPAQARRRVWFWPEVASTDEVPPSRARCCAAAPAGVGPGEVDLGCGDLADSASSWGAACLNSALRASMWSSMSSLRCSMRPEGQAAAARTLSAGRHDGK